MRPSGREGGRFKPARTPALRAVAEFGAGPGCAEWAAKVLLTTSAGCGMRER